MLRSLDLLIYAFYTMENKLSRAFVSEWVCPENKCITLPLEEDGTYDFSVVPPSKFTRVIVSSATLPNSLCLTHLVRPFYVSLHGQEWGDGHRDRVTVYTQATHRYESQGEYTITIRGIIVGWRFGEIDDSEVDRSGGCRNNLQ